MSGGYPGLDEVWGQVYINGHLVDASHATVSAFDRGLLYGDGVYETVRAYSGIPFMLDAHIRRMSQGCSAARLERPPAEEIRNGVRLVLEANSLTDSYLRITLTRGATGRLWYDPTTSEATLTIIARPLPTRDPGKGISLMVSRFRSDERSPLAGVKHTGILSKIIARAEAIQNGMDDALLLDTQGRVSEATASNVFWISGGRLCTPSLDCGILAGITREILLEIGECHGMKVIEGGFSLRELLAAEEVFLTSTTLEIAPVHRVGQKEFDSARPATQLLAELFRKYVNETLT